MPKYRKKPVEIEAFQLTEETRWDNRDWPEWLNKAWNMGHDEYGAVFPAPHRRPAKGHESATDLVINTLEGQMLVNPSDWIIRGVAGELYPCQDAIFAATYEAVSAE
jgi:hypothetical protein